MTRQQLQGACLCGAVRLTAFPEKNVFDACHCGMCRKWSGGPIMTVHAGPGVTIEGAEAVTVYASSEWAERGFCSKCGTHLFYRLKKEGDYYLPLGLLRDTGAFRFEKQIFIDKKPASYSFADETENLTQAEVFAQHGG